MFSFPHIRSASAHPAAAAWLSRERHNGLVGIQLSVRDQPGVTAHAVLDELLASEAAIAAGRTRPAPRAGD